MNFLISLKPEAKNTKSKLTVNQPPNPKLINPKSHPSAQKEPKAPRSHLSQSLWLCPALTRCTSPATPTRCVRRHLPGDVSCAGRRGDGVFLVLGFLGWPSASKTLRYIDMLFVWDERKTIRLYPFVFLFTTNLNIGCSLVCVFLFFLASSKG